MNRPLDSTRISRGLAAILLSLLAPSALADITTTDETLLLAFDGGALDEFGYSVAISGDTLVIGSRGEDSSPFTESGAAYVYVDDGGGWSFEAKLLPPDPATAKFFGQSVTIDGDTVAVGATGDATEGTDAGAVYVFTRAAGSWSFAAKLTHDFLDPGDFFGNSVALSGSVLAVGAPLDDSKGPESGAIWVWEGAGATWVAMDHVPAPDGEMDDHFGFSVDTDGEQIVGGAWGDDHGMGFGAGSAYVIEFGAGGWSVVDKLVPLDSKAADLFGVSVALADDVIVVGALLDDDTGTDAGSAYVFMGGGPWFEMEELFPSDPAPGAKFGSSVAVDEMIVAVGRPDSDSGGPDSGDAYLFTMGAGGWVQFEKLVPAASSAGDLFGTSIAIDTEMGHGHVIVGAPEDADLGPKSGSSTVYGVMPTFGVYCTSTPNSTGSVATMFASGSSSVVANDLVLHAAPVPNQPGLFFYGAATTSGTLGNGSLCVGSTLYRLPVEFASGNHLSHALDNTAAPSGDGTLVAGSTWYFQLWFRDPGFGVGYGTSEALYVVFTP